MTAGDGLVLRLPRRAATAEVFLEAAERLLGEFRSIRGIAPEADSNDGLAHHYVGAMDALVVQVLEHYTERLVAEVRALGASTETPAQNELSELSKRELGVLALVAEGLSNEEIAASLYLSVRTVERHLSNIYSKLRVSGKAARAAAAVRFSRCDSGLGETVFEPRGSPSHLRAPSPHPGAGGLGGTRPVRSRW